MFLCVSVPRFFAQEHCAALLSDRKKIRLDSCDTKADMSPGPTSSKIPLVQGGRHLGWLFVFLVCRIMNPNTRRDTSTTGAQWWMCQNRPPSSKEQTHVPVFNVWVISLGLLSQLKNNDVPMHFRRFSCPNPVLWSDLNEFVRKRFIVLTRIWASSWLICPTTCSGWPWRLTPRTPVPFQILRANTNERNPSSAPSQLWIPIPL